MSKPQGPADWRRGSGSPGSPGTRSPGSPGARSAGAPGAPGARAPGARSAHGILDLARRPRGDGSTTGQPMIAWQSNRWLAMFMALVVLASFIMGRLVYIQVYAAGNLQKMAENQRTDSHAAIARRGTIYDRNRLVLATSVDTVAIHAYLPNTKNPVGTAYHLSEVLGGEPSEWLAKLTDVQSDVVDVCLVRYADLSLEEALEERNAELMPFCLAVARLKSRVDPKGEPVWTVDTPLSGIDYIPGYHRVYPYGSVGSQVIGAVGYDGHGVSGMERMYDQVLSGRDGTIKVEVANDEKKTPLPNGTYIEDPKVDGEDIVISLDIVLQEYAESELSRLGALGATDEGSVIMLDGATGEIYVAASLPLFDRDNLTQEGIVSGVMNLRGILTPFEPGSTMKSITAAGALEAGVVNTEELFEIPNSIDIDGVRIKDWYDHPTEYMDLRQILSNSSNIGITQVGNRLGRQGLFDYFYRAGFLQPTHVDYIGLDGIGEPLYLSDATDPQTGAYLSIMDKPEYWSNVMASNLTFGQGLYVTGLQMASFYGALATGGERVSPHFLLGWGLAYTSVEYASQRIMEQSTADVMTYMLQSVFTEGTGVSAAVPGYGIAGKTGTAEKASPQGGYSSLVTQSVVGYIADSDCDLVCMVSMEDPLLVDNARAPHRLFASIMEYMANRYMVEPNG